MNFPSQGFVSLLSSQTIDLDSSEIPIFSSQTSDESVVRERRKWTPTEDVILIGAWLNTSKDPIVSNDQKAGAFWKRIQEYYNSNPALSGMVPREAAQCKQRWGRLNDQVCKFVGCFETAQRQQSSGEGDDDVMKKALELFYNDHGIKFTMEHAWRELRHDQKWKSSYVPKGGAKDKRKNPIEVDGQGEEEERPIGVKAAKREAKRKKTGKDESLSQLQAMIESRENIGKHKLLQTLLSKSEPLSEIEESLKVKLMTEML